MLYICEYGLPPLHTATGDKSILIVPKINLLTKANVTSKPVKTKQIPWR